MRVAILSATLPPYACGVGKHTYFLANALHQTGNDTTVVSLEANRNATEGVFNLDASLQKFGVAEYIKWAKQNKGQYDVVHLQYPTKLNRRGVSVVLLPWILRIYGFKSVLTLHELSEASWLGKFRNIFLSLGFSRIILPNPADAKWLRIKTRSIKHVSLGPTLIGHGQEKLKLSINSIGFLGFMDGSKGEEDLLRALALLKLPGKAYFLTRFDPKHNQHHANLLSLVEELNISDMIEWVNPRGDQEIINYLSSVDMVVMPFKRGVTRRNSTLLEAICAYKPIIVSDGGELPHYLVDATNALKVKPGNIEQLVDSIEAMIKNEKLRHSLTSNTQKLAGNFSWESIAKQTLEVYKR